MKLVISILLLITSCVNAKEFSDGARKFSLLLLNLTQQEADSGHVAISPFGVWSLMVIVSVGAEGNSQYQLTRALRLPKNYRDIVNVYQALSNAVLNVNTESNDITLSSNNFMFIDQEVPLNPDFQGKVQTDFNTEITNLQFSSPEIAAQMANSIIKDTGSTVSDVFNPDVFSQSRFILTNVINFKGLWRVPFNESDTKVEPFYDENNNKIGEAKFMYKKDAVPFSNMESLQSIVLELPYGNDGKFCLLILLPNPKVTVAEVYQSLAYVSIKDIFIKLQSDAEEFETEEVEITLPRFKISSNIVLNGPLMNLGVLDIFDERLANFSPITTEGVYVSSVIHNANMEVTESGTTASAVTTAEFQDRSSTPRFEANRPFIYFLMEKPTATIIFGGIYSKPSVF